MRKLNNCKDEGGDPRSVYFSVTAENALYQSSIDNDASGIHGQVAKAKHAAGCDTVALAPVLLL